MLQTILISAIYVILAALTIVVGGTVGHVWGDKDEWARAESLSFLRPQVRPLARATWVVLDWVRERKA